MSLNEDRIFFVLDKFLENPERMRMGSGKLSKRYKCNREDIIEARRLCREKLGKENTKLPKILILDIETAPVKAYVWRLWQQDVYLDQIISDWFMLTWSAKWLFDSNIMSDRLTGKEAKKENDKRIVEKLYKLLDEADIVIAHNGDKFDIPKINARFLFHGLSPTTPYKQIDTKKVAAKQFGFSSNKLDALANFFGFDNKIDTDFMLWKNCLDGDDQSLKYMEEYNQYDVQLLEDVYLKLRPWIKSHPNIAMYVESDSPRCSNCGSSDLQEKGHYFTNTGKYKTKQCNSCGAFSRERTNSYDKDKRKKLLTSIPR